MPKILGHVFDGKKTDMWSIDPDIWADSYLDPKAGVIRTFSDRKAFLRWLKDAGAPGNIQEVIKKSEEIKKQYKAKSEREKSDLVSQQIVDFQKNQRTARNVLRRHGMNTADDLKALLRLHKAGELGSMIVYDAIGCVGSWTYLPPGPYVKLSPFGWNDRISSLYNLGLWVVCYQHTWFNMFCTSGHTLWIPPLAKYNDLGWWSNRISSIYVYV